MIYAIFGLAIASGVSGTLLTRASQGFRKWHFGLLAVFCYAAATILMGWLVQRIPVGVVYAMWTGVAAVVLLVADRLVYKERLTPMQFVGTGVALVGVVLLSGGVR